MPSFVQDFEVECVVETWMQVKNLGDRKLKELTYNLEVDQLSAIFCVLDSQLLILVKSI